MVKGLLHVGIPVIDQERARDFLCDLLGFKVCADFTTDSSAVHGVPQTHLRVIVLDSPGGKVELLKNIGPNPPTGPAPVGLPPYWHVALEVADLDGTIQKTKELGYQVMSAEVKTTNSDHAIFPNVRLVYVRGPENIVLELVQRLP